MATFENSIGQEMESMHNNMARMEQQMENTFDDSMHAMPAFTAGDGEDGEVQSQSMSSSTTSEMGADGKMHTKTVKSGDHVKCHNGVCTETKCKDGKCKEYASNIKPHQSPANSSHARHRQTKRKQEAPTKKMPSK